MMVAMMLHKVKVAMKMMRMILLISLKTMKNMMKNILLSMEKVILGNKSVIRKMSLIRGKSLPNGQFQHDFFTFADRRFFQS